MPVRLYSVCVVVWLTILCCGVLAEASESAADQSMRTISVSGEGKATAPPDMATIRTGVVAQANTAREALKANNQAMDRILLVLKSHKIAAKDIQTSNFDVRPEHRRGPRGQQQSEITGYRVTNQLRVHVRSLPDLGEVLDALVAAGSNQISGISFSIDDPTGVLNQARNRAISDARARAELYAQAAGVRVGKVISISEQRVATPRPQYVGRALAPESISAVPVATGEHEVQATIHMTFALVERQ